MDSNETQDTGDKMDKLHRNVTQKPREDVIVILAERFVRAVTEYRDATVTAEEILIAFDRARDSFITARNRAE